MRWKFEARRETASGALAFWGERGGSCSSAATTAPCSAAIVSCWTACPWRTARRSALSTEGEILHALCQFGIHTSSCGSRSWSQGRTPRWSSGSIYIAKRL